MNKKSVLTAIAVMCTALTACTAANDNADIVSETEIVTNNSVKILQKLLQLRMNYGKI